MAIYDNRVCKECGKTFSGGPRAWYCPECRENRRRERDRLRQKKGPNRKLGSTDYCVACGKPYIVNSGLQKYCPKCAPEQIAEIDRKQGLEYYTTNKDQINPKRNAKRAKDLKELTCAVCGKKFLGYENQKVCGEACRKEYIKMCAKEYESTRERILHQTEFTCVICGKKSLGVKYQKTCSEECRKEYIRLKAKKYALNKKRISRKTEFTCVICGKKLLGRKNQKTCSTECRKEYARECSRNQKRISRKTELTCAICGKKFLGAKNHKTCSEECREAYKKEYNRELYRKKKQKK